LIAVRFVSSRHICRRCQLIVDVLVRRVIVVVVVITPCGDFLVSVVHYEGNARGLLGYVPYGYDAIVIINFVVDKFICVGVYDRHCCHSCNTERPDGVNSAFTKLRPLAMLTRKGTPLTNMTSTANVTSWCHTRITQGICT
jgi:hypothetical protein